MESVYDRAHELARALLGSEEYRDFVRKKEAMEADEKAKRMLDDYKRRYLATEAARMTGQEVAEDEVDELNRLGEILGSNTVVRDFLRAEQRLGQLIYDIQGIIRDGAPEWFSYESELFQGMTGG